MSLTNSQLEILNSHIDDQEKKLRREIQAALTSSDNQHYIDLAAEVGDVGDQSVADLLVDIAITTIDREINAMRDIEAARERMRSGNYGVCIKCGDAIDYQRLFAFPTAKRCYNCQRLHEKTYVTQAIPSL